MNTTLKAFQLSLRDLFALVTVTGVILGYCWCQCLLPAIESGVFSHQKTYREVQIERGKQALERKNAKP